MHMADALLSPAAGGVFWVISGALIGYSANKIKAEKDYSKTPLMGVLGAFVFAAQMINFSIPGTGSSGHLGGGLLLAVLLGPHRAFITIASVLTIQCLFFADGGILALGCNIFNLGFFPAFIAYPFIYRLLVGKDLKPLNIAAASITAAVAGLLMGAVSVVFQTSVSGISELPLKSFLLFMLPVHFAIGIIEGIVVLGVLLFVARTEPSLLVPIAARKLSRSIYVMFAAASLVIGGMLAWYASSDPDGLEWSVFKVTGAEELKKAENPLFSLAEVIQEKLSFMPDYSFRASAGASEDTREAVSEARHQTSVAGVTGSLMVLLLAGSAGMVLRRRGRKPQVSA